MAVDYTAAHSQPPASPRVARIKGNKTASTSAAVSTPNAERVIHR